MSLEEYLQKHYTARTSKGYQREIETYLSNCKDASTAVYKDITAYIGELRKRYKNSSTLSVKLSSIKVYYTYLCDAGLREDNPGKSIKLRDKRNRSIQLQDLFTNEELEGMLEKEESYPLLTVRNKVLIGLLIYQGLQTREIAGLKVQDINLEAGTVYIKATSITNSRSLQLKANQIMLLHQYITEVRSELLKGNISEWLLIGIRKEGLTSSCITKYIMDKFRDSYPPKRMTAQKIRQSVIANLFKQGVDISLVQAFAGYKTLITPERYKQSEVSTLQAAVNNYHPLK